MSDRNEFKGSIRINGAVESDRVSVFFSSHSHEVAIRGVGAQGLLNKTLHLHPFDAFMLRNSKSDVMKAGFYYSISGTHVGAYSYGPLGHPGDGEFDYRPIKQFDVRSRYTAEDLSVQIEGVTESGTSGFSQYRDKPLPPWEFQVSFIVPRADMKIFFGFTDFNYPFFEEVLDACR